jgi:cereblon
MNTNKTNNILPELETKVKIKTELQADDWLCIACNKKITSDKERFDYNNQSEFQFINPSGYFFDIITFESADGCFEVGEPTMEFTWFDGHEWSFAICSRCSNHLGWKYRGKHSFYGLIKSRLIKGAALFN